MTRKRPASIRWDVPPEYIKLAERRTEFLLGIPMEIASFRRLLANAYLTGMADAADTGDQP